MRLINTHSLRLESFNGAEDDIPPYAILSHTWDAAEISFEDIQKLSLAALLEIPAFQKIKQTCLRARSQSLDYAWIDTCCIDKSSSAELSEAINSMFKYYAQSSICYVFMSDLIEGVNTASLGGQHFFSRKWFTRGWTLQELIAPRIVEFYDHSWTCFGTRDHDLLNAICNRTGIWAHLFREARCRCLTVSPSSIVRNGVCKACQALDSLPNLLDTFTVSLKMSWASTRRTTRTEDAAYCLLGLFNINMPLLYGEGNKAFQRLQEAVLRQSRDQSILLWRSPSLRSMLSTAPGCFAPSVEGFEHVVPTIGRRVFNSIDQQYEADFLGMVTPIEITDTALKLNLWVCRCGFKGTKMYPNQPSIGEREYAQDLWLGILDLAYDDDYLSRPAILLEYMGAFNLYRRVWTDIIIRINPRNDPKVQTTYPDILPRIEHGTDNEIESRSSRGLWSGITIGADVTVNLLEATRQEVGILVQRSPVNAVYAMSSGGQGTLTGPLYLEVKSEGLVSMTLNSGGSYPLVNSYESRSTHIAAPWTFEQCYPSINVYLGGLHFFDLEFFHNERSMGPPRELVVIWGMQSIEISGRRRTPESELAARPWCRIFDRSTFWEANSDAFTGLRPTQLYGGIEPLEPGVIQQRIQSARRKMARRMDWSRAGQVLQDGKPKPMFPMGSKSSELWRTDKLERAVVDANLKIQADLFVSLKCITSLDRTLYELKLEVKDGIFRVQK